MGFKDNILALFYPESIAVVGVSRNEKKVGRIIFENLLRSKVKVYPVNPNVDEINGVKVYKSLKDVPEADLVIVAVKNRLVPEILEMAGNVGSRAAIVISAGFSEVGNEKLEREIVSIAKRNEIAMLGPNCMGVIFPELKMNATFAPGEYLDGNFVFLSQSGALGAGVLDYLQKERIGFRAFVSLGNQAMLDASDFVDFFSNDEKVVSIGIYIESVKDGKKFLKSLSSSKKDIFVLKSGRTEAGRRAAKSHTGALITDDIIYTFAIKQARKKRVYDVKTFLETLSIVDRPKGRRVVVLTNSGGPAVLLSDFLYENGFKLVDLPEDVMEKLNSILPSAWSHGNPIDILGDATSDRYKAVLDILEKNNNLFDILIVVLTPLQMTDVENIAKHIVEFKKRTGKFVVTNFMGGKLVEEGLRILKENGIKNFFDGKLLARVLDLITPRQKL